MYIHLKLFFYFCAILFFNKNTMTKDLKQFFLLASIIVVVSLCASQIFFSTIFETFDFPLRITTVFFVCVATCASHLWVMKTVTDKPKAFNRVFMLQTTIKLFLYLIFIAVYLKFFREYGIPFTLHFLAVYLVLSIFEVSMILKFINEKSGRKSGNIEKSN
jgi:hypothetical protein